MISLADFNRKIWDTNTGECLATLQHGHIVRTVAFSQGLKPDFVGTGGFERRLRIYDVERSTLLASDQSSPSPAATKPLMELGKDVFEGAVKSLIWGPDGNVVVSASDDKTVRWWDIRAQAPISSFKLDGPLGSCELTNVAPSKGSKTSILAVAGGKNAYFFSGSVPGQLIKTVKTPHEIAAVALNSQDNKFVTGGSADTWVRVYSFSDEEELNLLKGHHGPVWTASFAPDNKLFATGSEDGTIKLWKFTSETYGLWK